MDLASPAAFGYLRLLSSAETTATYAFTYPDPAQSHRYYSYDIMPYALNYPLGEDYIKLSFENPVSLSEVRITGENGQRVKLWYTTVNEKLGYDDHTVHTPTQENGVWKFNPGDRVTTLFIHADCKNDAAGSPAASLCMRVTR